MWRIYSTGNPQEEGKKKKKLKLRVAAHFYLLSHSVSLGVFAFTSVFWGVFDLGFQEEEEEEVEKKNGDLNQVWHRFENSENPCQGEVTHRLQYSLAGTNHLPPKVELNCVEWN